MLDERTYHYFDVRGVTRVFDLTIDDSGWTMIRRDEDFWQRSAGRFHGMDAIDGTGENSFDAGHTWQQDFSVSYARVGRSGVRGGPGPEQITLEAFGRPIPEA